MHSANYSVIASVCDWLSRGDSVWLVTIIDTWGASPRPPGSLFAYNALRDIQSGSLSGGCIEEDLLAWFKSQSSLNRPLLKTYGESLRDQQRFQLPCGGRLQILVEYHEPTEPSLKHFRSIREALDARSSVCRCCTLETSQLHLAPWSGRASILLEENTLQHALGPVENLLIIGAGEVSRYLVPLAESLDFSVTLCDPREGYFSRNGFDPASVGCLKRLPDDLVRERFHDAHCAIVALAHDPRVDDLALLAALETDAFFVGAMGSEKTSRKRIARLSSLGLGAEALKRLKAPIGLPLGSKTPPEIAVSIAAQLLAERTKLRKGK